MLDTPELEVVGLNDAESDRYLGILGVSSDPLVSSDIIKDFRAAIIDLELTQVIDGNPMKTMS
jgi:glyceraldehyde 3-phosphate dehydrogenase